MEGNIGFIGFGNMAQAIARGLTLTGACDARRLFACAGHFDRLQNNTRPLGIQALQSAEEVVACSDFVVLAVKPYMVEAVLAPVCMLLKNKALVSVVASYDFAAYERILPAGTHHISTIPNTPVSVGEGILICEKKHSLSAEEVACFEALFGKIAMLEYVEEKQFSIAGTLSGCTPAFTAMYLEALADAGVKHGLSREAAYRLAAKMLCGTGKLYLQTQMHPGILKDAVCSPGGTTIRGVAALEKGGFRGIVMSAIDAAEE